jgi:hypothetical protein
MERRPGMAREYTDIIRGFLKTLGTNAISDDKVRDYCAKLEKEDSTGQYCSHCGHMAIYAGECEYCSNGYGTDMDFGPDWKLPDVKMSDLEPTILRLHFLLTKARMATARAMEFYNDLIDAQKQGDDKRMKELEDEMTRVTNFELEVQALKKANLNLQGEVDRLREVEEKYQDQDRELAGFHFWHKEDEGHKCVRCTDEPIKAIPANEYDAS